MNGGSDRSRPKMRVSDTCAVFTAPARCCPADRALGDARSNPQHHEGRDVPTQNIARHAKSNGCWRERVGRIYGKTERRTGCNPTPSTLQDGRGPPAAQAIGRCSRASGMPAAHSPAHADPEERRQANSMA